jgi:hypothetical protein
VYYFSLIRQIEKPTSLNIIVLGSVGFAVSVYRIWGFHHGDTQRP